MEPHVKKLPGSSDIKVIICHQAVDILDIHGFKFTDVLSLLKHTTLILLRMKYSIKIDIDD
jgi:hypothetical protein